MTEALSWATPYQLDLISSLNPFYLSVQRVKVGRVYDLVDNQKKMAHDIISLNGKIKKVNM